MGKTNRATVSDADLNHRSLRRLRQYATEDGTAPYRPKGLADLATGFGGKKAKETVDAEDVEELFQQQEESAQQKVPKLRPELLSAMKEGNIRSLTKMQCRIIGTITGADSTSVAQPSQSRMPTTKRIVAQKLIDRNVGVALALAQLTPPKSRAFPIVIASRTGNGETNSTLFSLEHMFFDKLQKAPTAGLTAIMTEEQSVAPKLEDTKGTLMVDAGAMDKVPEGFWKRCTHLVLMHEGGSEKGLKLNIPHLNPHCCRYVVVSAMSQLGDPIVTSFVGGATSGSKSDDQARAAEGPVMNVQSVVVDGISRLQALWILVNNLCGVYKKKVAVCFNSREITAFHCDLFFALPQETDFDILCDWETNTTDSTDVQQQFASSSSKGGQQKGTVLLSAFGYTTGADVVVQYDPCPLSMYSRRLSSLVANNSSQKNDSKQRLVVFLYPSEESAITAALLACNGQPGHPTVQMEKVTPPSTRFALSMTKVKSLVKNVFALATKAFEAYKSHLAIYARLQPSTMYNVRALNLEKVAQQFGLLEVPMLDLRLKDTEYRPSEDYYRPAMKRRRKDLMAMRKRAAEYAAENPPTSDSDDEEWGAQAEAQ